VIEEEEKRREKRLKLLSRILFHDCENRETASRMHPIKGGDILKEREEDRELEILRKVHELDLLFFSFGHLPERLQKISKPFYDLAFDILVVIASGDQRKNCLEELLRAKDSAVRAALHPGR